MTEQQWQEIRTLIEKTVTEARLDEQDWFVKTLSEIDPKERIVGNLVPLVVARLAELQKKKGDV